MKDIRCRWMERYSLGAGSFLLIVIMCVYVYVNLFDMFGGGSSLMSR